MEACRGVCGGVCVEVCVEACRGVCVEVCVDACVDACEGVKVCVSRRMHLERVLLFFDLLLCHFCQERRRQTAC